ncbi:MAG: 1-acyl-sn-glycerol-3-phosphate acyltransferase [Deltaproteobacteria bacterium]|nr:1-acyl-sn-glycerol-3-phosphate acyltransferase [Deltaproteobacteria bacterium]
MRPEDKERVLTELHSRVLATVSRSVEAGKTRPDEVLADSIYHEMRRLKEDRDSRTVDADRAFWNRARHEMTRASDRALLDLIGQAVDRYGNEIAGHFEPRLYDLVTRAGEPALGLLLNAMSPKRILADFANLPSLEDALVVQGELEHIRRLHEVGTVIVVPTHVSNMDSIIVGYALYRMGLPPFIYGAGLNLFSNPLIGFFMRNLGAYTVDRKKQDPLYKETLKEYATLTLEHGYDNIFFPGGTRCRSGSVEKRLKLGLLGTGLGAFINNLQRNKPNPRIFIVPATISYELVLEAETLIDDFLKEVGKSRYIITDDEFSRPKRVFDFVRQLFSLDSRIFFTLGRGMDPFGNPVDDEGESLDPRGRRVDPARYVLRGGKPEAHETRDAEYTREVGVRLSDAYFKDNVIQSTHVTARAIFSMLRRQNPSVDTLRLVRQGAERDDVPLLDTYREVERMLTELRGLAARGGVRLGPRVADRTAEDVVTDGLRHFSIYHTSPAALRRGDRVFPTDRALLLYYQNRLEGYRFEREEGLRPVLTSDHRALGRGGAA